MHFRTNCRQTFPWDYFSLARDAPEEVLPSCQTHAASAPTVEGKHVSGVGCSRIAMRPKPIIAGILLTAVAVVFLGLVL